MSCERTDSIPEGEDSTQEFGNLIASFLGDLEGRRRLYPYLHNDMSGFEPGKTPIFYSGPYWGREEIVAAVSSLLAGKWLAAGEEVRKFEVQFARRLGQRQSLMVNSGSSANLVLVEAAKRRFGWEDGDEVAISVVGFPTTAAPLLQARLKPVFIDIEWETLNFDLDLLEKSIGPRTKAVFLSPVLGNPPDLDRILRLCRDKGLVFLLDECDSLGTTWRGKHLGSYSAVSSHSFYSSHHLCTGEGGMVVSDDEELMKAARSLAWWGRDCVCVGKANLNPSGACGHRFDRWIPAYDGVIDHRYVFTEIGYNLKPLDLQGAIGQVQLTRLDEIVERRRAAKAKIGKSLATHLGVHVPGELEHASTSWFGVPVVAPDGPTKRAMVAHFEANKIQTRHYFAGNLLQQPGYSHLGDWRAFPVASQVLDRVFFIGAAPHYTQKVFDYIDDVARSFPGTAKGATT